jgi:two-component system response regulator YesN
MSNLKILIVDDEKYEAVLMEKCVDWQHYGFEIIGSAQSAREALTLFNQAEPDIVLCDINMPVINGLELSRRMKEQKPDVHIIIVTGYREFAYAQQAVEIGIEKYILKPVQADELLMTAEKIQKEIAYLTGTGAATGNEEQPKGELTRTAVAYIESNLSASGLSLKSVASVVYSNGSYLSRIFKEETGETVTEYILRRRMEKSKKILGSTDMRAYEVAAMVGMPDAHYFGQCFKRFTGMTVNEYRQKMHHVRNGEKTV